MPGLVALVLAASLTSLPSLPQRGLVRETKAGVELQSLGGRPLGTLPGYDLAFDQATPHVAMLRTRRGVLYAFDGRTLRRRLAHGRVRIAAPRPRGIGHWVWAERSPFGGEMLAQWSGECETPVAYLVVGGKLQSYGPETVALGYLADGEAVVHFRSVGCGQPRRSGIYASQTSRKLNRLLRTPRFAQYLMWGG
jgi:hypothetical protein